MTNLRSSRSAVSLVLSAVCAALLLAPPIAAAEKGPRILTPQGIGELRGRYKRTPGAAVPGVKPNLKQGQTIEISWKNDGTTVIHPGRGIVGAVPKKRGGYELWFPNGSRVWVPVFTVAKREGRKYVSLTPGLDLARAYQLLEVQHSEFALDPALARIRRALGAWGPQPGDQPDERPDRIDGLASAVGSSLTRYGGVRDFYFEPGLQKWVLLFPEGASLAEGLVIERGGLLPRMLRPAEFTLEDWEPDFFGLSDKTSE